MDARPVSAYYELQHFVLDYGNGFFLLPISGFFCFAIVFCYMVTLFSSVWLEARLSNQKLKNRDRTVPSSVSSDVRDSLGLTISRGHVV